MTTTAEPAPSILSVDIREDGVRVVTLEGEKGKPFILSEDAIGELEALVTGLSTADGVKGLLIRTAHRSVFCAGADVDSMDGIGAEAIREIAARGQDLYDSIDALPFPVVALVHGTCVGGGLELVLACHARVASDDPKTRMGLPEVQLGILPAWGGTTRLPEMLGLMGALPLLLTGKQVVGKKALKLGLVTECCPKELMFERGLALIGDGVHKRRPRRKRSIIERVMEGFGPARRFVLNSAKQKTLAQTHGHYPAPMAILDTIERGFGKPREQRLALERDALASLLPGPVAQSLVSIFRRNRDAHRGAPYDSEIETPRIRRAAVVGGGVMGAGIATALLLKGLEVRLIDPFPEALGRAQAALDAELKKRTRRRRLDRAQAAQIAARFAISIDMRGLKTAEIIIEAVPEVIDLKKSVLADIARHASPEALIATNTSSLALSELESAIDDPGRFGGLHFFNPAPKMPLVEVVRGPQTTERTLVSLLRFARAVGKVPVVVDDSPAFVVNRLLTPYMMTALELLEAGADVAAIDGPAKAFGLPMGPLELMDTVGLDVAYHVAAYLIGIPRLGFRASPILGRLAEAGDLGQKSGRGFYDHRGKKPTPRSRVDLGLSSVETALPDIERKLLDALRDEAAKVLEEGVVATADDLDLASIFGMGFPPFTGGIARWAAEETGR